MLQDMEFDNEWRKIPEGERLKFIALQVFSQGKSLMEFKTTLINHEDRLIRIEHHKSGNPDDKESRKGNHNKVLFAIGAGVAALTAGVVLVLRWLGLIK